MSSRCAGPSGYHTYQVFSFSASRLAVWLAGAYGRLDVMPAWVLMHVTSNLITRSWGASLPLLEHVRSFNPAAVRD